MDLFWSESRSNTPSRSISLRYEDRGFGFGSPGQRNPRRSATAASRTSSLPVTTSATSRIRYSSTRSMRLPGATSRLASISSPNGAAREPAQRIADRIDELMGAAGGPEPVATSSAPDQVMLRSLSHGAEVDCKPSGGALQISAGSPAAAAEEMDQERVGGVAGYRHCCAHRAVSVLPSVGNGGDASLRDADRCPASGQTLLSIAPGAVGRDHRYATSSPDRGRDGGRPAMRRGTRGGR